MITKWGGVARRLTRKTKRAYLCQMRQRIIWIGGWERANCGGWRLRLSNGQRMPPYPIMLFRRVTLHGKWADIKLRRRSWLVISWRKKGKPYAYISPDGTPNRATKWLWGRYND